MTVFLIRVFLTFFSAVVIILNWRFILFLLALHQWHHLGTGVNFRFHSITLQLTIINNLLIYIDIYLLINSD